MGRIGHSESGMGVVIYEWVGASGKQGAISTFAMDSSQRAKLDERLDRIEELPNLSFDQIRGLLFPFDGPLKKMKIHGNVALRPIAVLGPDGVTSSEKTEVTILVVATEKDNKLQPNENAVKALARSRLAEITANPTCRRMYERT